MHLTILVFLLALVYFSISLCMSKGTLENKSNKSVTKVPLCYNGQSFSLMVANASCASLSLNAPERIIIQVNATDIPFEVDTGSGVTLMSETFLKRHFSVKLLNSVLAMFVSISSKSVLAMFLSS